jgi:hypothetical protein
MRRWRPGRLFACTAAAAAGILTLQVSCCRYPALSGLQLPPQLLNTPSVYSWAREEAAGPKLWSVACFCLHALAFSFSGPRVTVALLSQYAQVEAVWALLSSTLWQHGLGQCHERSGGRVFGSRGSTLVALPEWVLVVEAAQRMQRGEGGWEDRPSGCCGWVDACMDAEQPLLHACLGNSSEVLFPQLTSACIMVCWGYGGLLLVGLCLLASDELSRLAPARCC